MSSYGLAQGGATGIVTTRAERISGRETVVPSLASHPDALPKAPSPWDVEFDRPIRQGYTLLGSPTWDVNSTVKHHLYMSVPASTNRSGLFWPLPTVPFTATAKFADWDAVPSTTSNAVQAGIALCDASPDTTNIEHLSLTTRGNGTTNTRIETGSATSLPESAGFAQRPPVYLRLVVNSQTDVDAWFSFNGRLWTQVMDARNPGFTLATFGVYVAAFGANPTTGFKACFGWLRVTTP